MKNVMKIFNEYVKNYDLKKSSIMGKFHHSYRVMELSKEIATSLNLNNEDIKLASIIGLLHDIGRFEQCTKYETFIDDISIDHGDLAEEILKQEILSKLDLEDNDKKIILTSVRNHNKFMIEPNLKEKELLMCQIIRDADKLDILKEQIKVMDKNYDINKELINILKEHKLILNKYVKTPMDGLCRHISLLFDLHFPYSYKFVQKNNIVDNIMNMMEIYSNTNQEELEIDVKKYIKERLSC